MRKVTKDEFFRAMGPLNVHPSIKTGYPYSADWETPDRQVIGRSVDRRDGGTIATDYYLNGDKP